MNTSDMNKINVVNLVRSKNVVVRRKSLLTLLSMDLELELMNMLDLTLR